MHKCLFEVAWFRGFVLGGAETCHSFLTDIGSQRVDTGDEDVEAKVEFDFLDE